MKDLSLTKAISFVTTTLTAVMFMSSVALITPATANRLTENPNIHEQRDWRIWHEHGAGNAFNARIPNKVMYKTCVQKCSKEGRSCFGHYWNFKCKIGQNRNRSRQPSEWCDAYEVIVKRDCLQLEQQCKTQECSRYR